MNIEEIRERWSDETSDQTIEIAREDIQALLKMNDELVRGLILLKESTLRLNRAIDSLLEMVDEVIQSRDDERGEFGFGGDWWKGC